MFFSELESSCASIHTDARFLGKAPLEPAYSGPALSVPAHSGPAHSGPAHSGPEQEEEKGGILSRGGEDKCTVSVNSDGLHA